ncbi:MAG TPA: hypothetical protein VI386_17895 [Candidatus Sulfotelmatobacter sp.]
MRRLLPLLLLLFVGCAKKPVAISAQQKAEHLVFFYTAGGREDGLCTATAIGPHAFMTAAHCNDSDEPNKIVEFDYSTQKIHLLAGAKDGRDHVIYLIDGPAFQNTVDVQFAVKPAGAKEKVYIYGCGGGIFPPRLLSGIANRFRQASDSSDVDAHQHLRYYTIPVIPGDSGSAIFGEDGRILSLVAYRHYDGTSSGFELAFTKEQLAVAKAFDPSFLGLSNGA